MRHTVHVMFGQDFSETLPELVQYIIKYGEKAVEPYFTALLWQEKEDLVSIDKFKRLEEDENAFVSGIDDQYKIGFENVLKSTSEEVFIHLKSFLLRLRNETITILNPGDFNELHFCLYMPLYVPEVWKSVQLWIKVAKSERYDVHIDLIGFSSDMAELFGTIESPGDFSLCKELLEKQNVKIFAEIVDYKKVNLGYIQHFVVIQNSQSQGVALALNKASLIRIIGEFALMCVERYRDIFGVGVCPSEVQAIGVSMLSLDKYYFIEYLLQRTYLHAMDRENICDKEVDVNMSAEKAQKMLSKWANLMSSFFDREIKSRLDDKIEKSTIVTEITPLLDLEFEKMGDDFESYISDDYLSIPQKRAILAALLGQDDALFVNDIFNKKQLIVDDLDREAMNMFIKSNNSLLENDSTLEKALLSVDGEPVVYPLDEIKELRIQLRQSSGYMRELQKEKEKLQVRLTGQHEAEKCLIKGGYFIYGHHQYRLMPDNIIDEPLKDNYAAHAVKAPSIDLRSGFTPIKSQGQQGACLAFALTSVYEYFLKLNKDDNPNLSEAFLYYNAREKVGKTSDDQGAILGYSIESLTEQGICVESLCPYDENIYDRKPSPEAYADASGRRVRRALNVKCTIDDIKSALEDGYPVAICLNLYPSFGSGYKGFVTHPSEEEKNNEEKREEHGRHAMVVCGYSQENKFFIVRNSWGEDFGDHGYCYLPYSYVADSTLMNWACIITEVEACPIVVIKEKNLLQFDRSDANLMYAITCNLIEVEGYFQQLMLERDSLLQRYYFNLKQKLKNKNLQDVLKEGSDVYLNQKIENAKSQKEILKEQKKVALDDFDAVTRSRIIMIVGFVLFTWLSGYVLYKFVVPVSLWWVPTVTVILGLLSFLYFPWRKTQRTEVARGWDDRITEIGVRIERLIRETESLDLRMHLAGMLLIRLFSLSDRLLNKYNAMKSFMNNLNIWYNEEISGKKKLCADTQPPFISLLNNDVLDTYFDEQKEKITEGICLWGFLQNYELNENGIRRFQQELKQTVVERISTGLEEFDVYSYISGNKRYSYLLNSQIGVKELLGELDRKSDVFLHCNDIGGCLNPQKAIFVRTATDKDTKCWDTTYPAAFSVKPMSYNIISPFKIVVFRLQELNTKQVVYMN